MSILYHWHIPSMSCQGQSVWFPWSVCLIPTSILYIHQQKSTKYNICVPNISLTHLLYVMSRSVWLIPLVSLSWQSCWVVQRKHHHRERCVTYLIAGNQDNANRVFHAICVGDVVITYVSVWTSVLLRTTSAPYVSHCTNRKTISTFITSDHYVNTQ